MAEPANKLTAEMDSRAAVKGRKPSIATRVLAEQLRRDPPGQWTDNRLEQSNHYAGITYIAVKAIMNAIKGCTIRVTKRDRDGARAMLKGGTVTKAMPTMHSQANDHEWVPFTDPGHSLIRLLEKPNPTETIQDILCQVILQYNLTGSGHLWKNPDKLELPCELYVLPTALCQAQPPVPEFPEGWWRVTQYYPSGAFGIMPSPAAGGGSPVDKRQVATLKNPHPLWRWDAFSPLTAGKLQIDILESIDRARWTAMDAGVTPSAMLLAPGLNQQELDAALDRIAENNAGKRNHRKVLGIGGEQGGGADSGGSWSVSFPDAAPKDMDFSSGWDQMVGFDFALFGVPKEAANLSGVSSYSALYASLKQFYALTLRPLCIDLSNWLTRNLAHAWSDDLAIIVDLPPIDGDELIEKQIAVDLQYDLVTYNEMRALRSRPPVDGGDVPVSVYKANALAKAQAEQAKQAKQQQQQGMPAPGGGDDGEETKPPFFREQSATGVKSLKKPENKQAVGNMPPKVDKEYQKFACAYIKLEPEYAAYILELGKRVDDHFLADDGREDEPHVTVRYGIHDCEPSDVQKVVEGFGTVQYHLGEVGYFDGKLSGRDYDVVIVKVTSNRLNELHGLLGQLPHTDTHAAYCPHATVAYVKLGMGHIYADIFSKMNVMCETSKMVFSDAKHNKSTISLAMPTRVEKDAMSYLNDSAGGALVPPAGCAKKVRKKKRRRRLARMIANAVTKAVGQPAITGDDVGAAIDALLVEKGYTHAVAKDAKWDEDKHPRDHGKFSSKPGGSGGKSDDSKGSSKSSSKASTGDHSGAVNIADSDNANTDDIGSPNEDDIFAFMDSDPSVRSDDDDKPLTIDADNVESDPNIDDSTLSRQKVALRASPIAKSDSLDRPGANESVKVTLDDGTEAVFKPSEGETFLRVGVPTGGFYKREAAASSVADILGFGDLVPPTTIREHGGRTGSIQKFVPNAKSAFQIKTEAMYDGEEDLSRSAAFDYIIGHSDRHQGNWLLSSEGKLTLIDNGLSFPVRKEASDYWNGQFWPRVIQQQLKIPDLSGLKDKWPQVEDALRQHGLNDDAVALTKQRFDAVVENSGGYFQHLPSLVDDNDQLSHMLVKSNQLVPVAKGKSSSAPIRIS